MPVVLAWQQDELLEPPVSHGPVSSVAEPSSLVNKLQSSKICSMSNFLNVATVDPVI